MVLSVLLNIMYRPPANLAVTAISVFNLVSMAISGRMEVQGKHLQYSKLQSNGTNNNNNENNKNKNVKIVEKAKVPSQLGMFVIYAPAFLAGVSSFALRPSGDLRFNLVRSAITTHFLKRVLEVLFVHKFSGSMDAEIMILLSVSYLLSALTMIYNQELVQGLPEPVIDLKYVGIAMFLLGIGGNFYHHFLLSKLRKDGEKVYQIPQGGLFSLVICPHYLFEIFGFLGISCICQTLYPLCFTVGSVFYLMGRSYATREWYESKFEDFPKEVKALIPYIF
ncbi:hypothetical protein ABFS82_06G158300 [Erythranthe guttata]|uniref:3-oxo-5-alpha-steroid 4-dehydrogenase C-terminal domain-containing protein n=1 Tax=Erythranthe guttata TaxID=4155 RepID=A0A022REA2_ERYGU|nr:PREDICTED: 3-oxo-5-alpha-steroid 4-dehydrogenase 2-like [Erythranthe guttata]EYU38073.1 hypothetical protein MIMGU_mgv1a011531mg [Erythranthe guttata]|eukprot:XP_012836691.1 PREDICTED: 3-oxo-5-alpha-steroid 4-dehydrogenase 2-like [Erythranthe guttata]